MLLIGSNGTFNHFLKLVLYNKIVIARILMKTVHHKILIALAI
jgi:hypothetical protein